VADILPTLMHYNLQYCAGGLEGLFPQYEATEEQLEDDIIEESLDPVLGVLEAHPSWTFDVEMQGLMVDVIAERHPDTLARMQALAAAGQLELVSFHWSDTLWTAFPRRDAEVSAELTRTSFADAGLPLSEVVFTQEGQFSEGMLEVMPEWGWSIAVLPPNLAEYLWGTVDEPLYRYGDVRVLTQAPWTFLNDGELWATNDLNCYLGPAFVYDEDATAARVADLEAAEAAGYTIGSISAFVAGIETGDEPELPPVLDGTWQPDDTEDLGLWMGGAGIWGSTEDDDGVRRANAWVGEVLRAVEAVPEADADAVEAAWKEALKAEVSDATGWNPFETEVQYAHTHAAAALGLASEALRGPCEEAGASRVVVAADGMLSFEGLPADEPVADGERPGFQPALSGRTGTTTWAASEWGWTLAVSFEAGEGTPTVTFPWDGLTYETVPALGSALVAVDADAIAADGIALPLASGVVHLQDGWYVGKDLRTVHLAGHFDRAAGTLAFLDETAGDDAVSWSFELTRDGAGLAERVRPVELACPAGPGEATLPCGCASGRSGAGAWLLLGTFAAARRLRQSVTCSTPRSSGISSSNIRSTP
jgi:hypothetical protein